MSHNNNPSRIALTSLHLAPPSATQASIIAELHQYNGKEFAAALIDMIKMNGTSPYQQIIAHLLAAAAAAKEASNDDDGNSACWFRGNLQVLYLLQNTPMVSTAPRPVGEDWSMHLLSNDYDSLAHFIRNDKAFTCRTLAFDLTVSAARSCNVPTLPSPRCPSLLLCLSI